MEPVPSCPELVSGLFQDYFGITHFNGSFFMAAFLIWITKKIISEIIFNRATVGR